MIAGIFKSKKGKATLEVVTMSRLRKEANRVILQVQIRCTTIQSIKLLNMLTVITVIQQAVSEAQEVKAQTAMAVAVKNLDIISKDRIFINQD
jgi:hypothetical protein